MQIEKEIKKDPLYPYSLPSHKAVDIYPLGEMWAQGKPYLYIGSSSSNKGDYVYFINAITLQQHEHKTARGNLKQLGVYLEGKLVNTNWQWPDDYVKTLKAYKWADKTTAKSHGYNHKNNIHLIHKYNKEWGLFRCSAGEFESIFMEEVREV